MRGIPLYGGHDLGDQIVASLQLDVDIRPGTVHRLPELDKAVEDDDGTEKDGDRDQELPHE